VLDAPGEDPIVCDLGTGLRSWGDTQPLDGSFRATALVTHFHFDHVQGLPFLAAADRIGSQFDIYGPGLTGHDVKDQFTQFVRPPFFPVTIDQLRGSYRLHDISDESFSVGGMKVRSRPVPHVGLTLGFRIEHEGISVAYVPDHQAPVDFASVADAVLDLCDGVDLLIHDAQYVEADWEAKAHWGHSTIAYSIEVAARCGAKALALFHHDPSRGDDDLDRLALAATREARAAGIDVFAAAERMTVDLTRPIRSQVVRRASCGPMFGR
jgi:phosphoribosyl 1,2-cyclic phosphodiesterase